MKKTAWRRWVVVLMGLLQALAMPGGAAEAQRRRPGGAGAETPAPAPALPDAVSKAFKATFPQGTVADVETEVQDGVTVYSIECSDGKTASIAADGTVMEIGRPVQASQVPAAVMNAIKKSASGATVGQIERTDITYDTENGKLIKLPAPVAEYTAELKNRGRTGEVVVGSDGSVVEPVTWE